MKRLYTDRLILRSWEESDAPALYKYASDPDLGPSAGWPPHKSLDESFNIIKTIFNCDTMWAVQLKDSSEAIGCIGYLPPECSNIKIGATEAEVGYWIARPFWSQGICSEALKVLIDYCFNEKGFIALWGTYFIDNPHSGRVMSKCGFLDCDIITTCPKLDVGSDSPVRVVKLESD